MTVRFRNSDTGKLYGPILRGIGRTSVVNDIMRQFAELTPKILPKGREVIIVRTPASRMDGSAISFYSHALRRALEERKKLDKDQ